MESGTVCATSHIPHNESRDTIKQSGGKIASQSDQRAGAASIFRRYKKYSQKGLKEREWNAWTLLYRRKIAKSERSTARVDQELIEWGVHSSSSQEECEKNISTCDTGLRIMAIANTSYRQTLRIFTNRGLNAPTKMMVYNGAVLPSLLRQRCMHSVP